MDDISSTGFIILICRSMTTRYSISFTLDSLPLTDTSTEEPFKGEPSRPFRIKDTERIWIGDTKLGFTVSWTVE